MKDIIDVMQLQQDTLKLKQISKEVIDYRKSDIKGLVPRFLFECAIKLEMKPLTSATAAVLYHRFYREVDKSEYGPFMIASSCLYLAGKVKDDPVKIRDVINVAHNTLNRDAAPLELGDEYWSMRDSIVQAELMITRVLKFELSVVHPHKYMLHYMKTLQEWFGTTTWNALPIAKVAASYLQDFHHSAAILDFKASHVAVCCLSLAFQTYGITVPLTDENDENLLWYQAFVHDLSKEQHWEIIGEIIEVYNNESDIKENNSALADRDLL